MARLIVAREETLTHEGYFRNHQEMEKYVQQLETLAAEPSRKDLRWQLDIDDDLLSNEIRQCEFVNWLNKVVLAR
jgi:GMP synthase (glutamine-hydrolysing)